MIPREDNIGGVYAAYIRLNGVFIFPTLQSSGGLDKIFLNTMDQIPIHPFRASFNSSPSETDQGILYNNVFETGVPSDHELVRNLVKQYQGREVILIIQDLDFQYWLIQDRIECGKFLSAFTTGTQPSEGKNHAITITGITTSPRLKLTLV